MEYRNEIKLRDNQECIIRNAVYDDGPEVSELFEQTHGESDYLLSYPEENSFDAQGESEFLQKRAESNREVMLVAVLDNKIVATAGISEVGHKYKVRHRAEFGIDVAKAYWGLGIGRAMMNACVEFGRNPMGFVSKYTGVQELVYMRLVL